MAASPIEPKPNSIAFIRDEAASEDAFGSHSVLASQWLSILAAERINLSSYVEEKLLDLIEAKLQRDSGAWIASVREGGYFLDFVL